MLTYDFIVFVAVFVGAFFIDVLIFFYPEMLTVIGDENFMCLIKIFSTTNDHFINQLAFWCKRSQNIIGRSAGIFKGPAAIQNYMAKLRLQNAGNIKIFVAYIPAEFVIPHFRNKLFVII